VTAKPVAVQLAFGKISTGGRVSDRRSPAAALRQKFTLSLAYRRNLTAGWPRLGGSDFRQKGTCHNTFEMRLAPCDTRAG
jgi:hypothetical protein